MTQTNDLNQAVRSYIALMAFAAVIVVALSVLFGSSGRSTGELILAVALASSILAAQYFPVHLTHKTKVYVDTTILVAAVLLLPPWLAIVIAATTAAIHELTIRVSWEQGVFNIAQTVIYVGAGAWIFHALADSGSPPELKNGQVLAAALAGVVVMHLLNTLAVAVAGGLQLGRPPIEFWLESIWLDLPEHFVLVANGLLLAFAAGSFPWLLPLVAGPLVLVYLSLRRSAELRETTRAMQVAISDLNELLGRGTHSSPAHLVGNSRKREEGYGAGGAEPNEPAITSSRRQNDGVAATFLTLLRPAESGRAGIAALPGHRSISLGDTLDRRSSRTNTASYFGSVPAVAAGQVQSNSPDQTPPA
jgi:hypothetical protein